MLDAITVDQLRTFIAAASEGSFSAAGRKLNRAQSVVSHTIAKLEDQLGVKLFERVARYPVLTEEGRTLLTAAQSVTGGVDALKALAKGMAGGLEPELSVVIDVLFPLDVLTAAMLEFRAKFPTVPLRVSVEAMGGVVQPVLDRSCQLGVMGSLPDVPIEFAREPLPAATIAVVVAKSHPLAACKKPITRQRLAEHTQLVLSDRTDLTKGRQFGVLSPKVWHLTDIGAKHAFLLAGLGWGGMPLGMVQADIERKLLVRLAIEEYAARDAVLPMWAVYRSDSPPGPAGRWLIQQIRSKGQQQKLR